ncbi:MAG: hypothetical protein ACKVIQ_20845 [Acidimicrobiales bacterium]
MVNVALVGFAAFSMTRATSGHFGILIAALRASWIRVSTISERPVDVADCHDARQQRPPVRDTRLRSRSRGPPNRTLWVADDLPYKPAGRGVRLSRVPEIQLDGHGWHRLRQ